jgi:ATP-dependent Lon protease
LSKVVFLTTANTTETIPAALLDRLEIINLSGYTEEEKLEIAKRFLLPKLEESHGIEKGTLEITDTAYYNIISLYTRESGVRALEREIARICRRTAKQLVELKTAPAASPAASPASAPSTAPKADMTKIKTETKAQPDAKAASANIKITHVN